jgi:uncharacterized protein (TIRG00374 family)
MGEWPEPEVSAPSAQARPRRRLLAWIPRPLRHGISVFLLLLLVEYVVIPSFLHSKERSSLSALGHVNILGLIAGFALESGSLVAYGRLTQTVLPKDGPRFSTVLRIDLSTLAVSHVLPGGTAGGTGLGYRLLTSNGVSGPDAGFALGTQGIGSAVVLNAMLWVALVISIPLHGFNSAYVTVAVVGAVLLAALGALILALTRGEQHAAHVLRTVARRVPRISDDQIEQVVRRLGERLRTLGSDRRLLERAVLWAAANWLLDASALWAFLTAFGHVTSPIDLFVAYGVANIVAAVPLTPGGLGFVEAVAATSLIGFGVPGAVAWLGVISWRLFNFWLPIPVGAGAYLSLRVERGAGLRERRTALGTMTSPIDSEPVSPDGESGSATPGPVTPGPLTPGPVTPGSVTPGPVTPGPVTPNPPPQRSGPAAPPAPSAPPRG